MLKTNTFRPDRYLRSKFLEGRYLLATELVDVELELLDQFRKSIKTSIGNVAVGSGWEVAYYENSKVVIRPGSAWYEGLPFDLRSATDHMVVPGILPAGMNPNNIVYLTNVGIVLDFTGIATANYTIIISAEENIVTDIQDPFLKNVTIPESTAQKIKLKYKINVVPTANQGSFAPYKNEAIDKNLTNFIEVTNTASGEGRYVSTSASSISENIDGSNLEVKFFNTSAAGPLPIVQADRGSFINGTLTDTTGQKYYITAIFTDTADNTVIRIDKDIDQPNPTFTIGQKYKLTKRDVYVTDSSGSGSPLGRLYWPIAKIEWDNAGGLFNHASKIEDIRGRIVTEVDYETAINEKLNLQLTGGGVIDVTADGKTLNWSDPFVIINPQGLSYTITANSAILLEGGTLAFDLSQPATTITPISITANSNSGSELTLASIDLSTVKVGNVITVGLQTAKIVSINNTNKIVAVEPAITIITPTSGFIYRHSFAEGMVTITENTYILATKNAGKIRVGGYLELSAGESNTVYDARITPVAGVITAGTVIPLPFNTSTTRPQYYNAAKRNLKVYVNQLLKYQDVDWQPVSPNQISFTYDLLPYTEIHFRIDAINSGAVGSAGSSSGSVAVGLFYKSESTRTAWTKTGVYEVTTGVTLAVENGGQIWNIPSGTSVTMTDPYYNIGGNYYIYILADGTLEARIDSSAPLSGSRRLGGFHFAPGGNTISEGKTAPQINPYSFWDLKWKPSCLDPRGMTLVANKMWVDIYFLGQTAYANINSPLEGTPSSVYNVNIADGSVNSNTTPLIPAIFGGNGITRYVTANWWNMADCLGSFGKRFPTVSEFSMLAYGTTEETTLGIDPVATGLSSGTYTSYWGVMQSTGCMLVWAQEWNSTGATSIAGGSDLDTSATRGVVYQDTNAAVRTAMLGGGWNTAFSGSRAARWNYAPSYSAHDLSARGVCDHLVFI